MKNNCFHGSDRLYLDEMFPETKSRPRQLYESGKSVNEIADMIGCERRTAARLIKENLEADDIGKWHVSYKKLSSYMELINNEIECSLDSHPSLYSFSRSLFQVLRKNGYTGSERTVRNYLMKQERVYWFFHNDK